MDELLTLSATTLAEHIRNRNISSLEVVNAHIDHIKKINPAINAVVKARFSSARQEARQADRRIASRNNDPCPPLTGVPFTIKESFAVKGMPNSSGLLSRKEKLCTHNALAVSRLLEAGAIPLGVTNTSELCMWIESNNRVYGRTNNAYNPNRIAGGSSGGEGAIVGAGGSPFGLASDIAGSIRLPAFFNGVFGHKPTGGMVPTTGHFPVPTGRACRYATIGPIARKAEDLPMLLKILAGPDGKDRYCKKIPIREANENRMSDLTVFNLPEFPGLKIQADLKECQENCIRSLSGKGARIKDISVFEFRDAFNIWTSMMTHAEKTTFTSVLGAGNPGNPFAHLVKWPFRKSPHTLPAIGLSIYEAIITPLKKHYDLGCRLKKELIERIGPNGVMILPSFTGTAPLHYLPMLKPFDWMLTGIFNVFEFPATQVPLGLNRKNLPLGVQVVGIPGKDHLTISVAIALEKIFGGWIPPNNSQSQPASIRGFAGELFNEGTGLLCGAAKSKCRPRTVFN